MANCLNQRGWRYFAADSVHQIFAALSAHGEIGALDLSYTRDDKQLFVQGPAPAQYLALTTQAPLRVHKTTSTGSTWSRTTAR